MMIVNRVREEERIKGTTREYVNKRKMTDDQQRCESVWLDWDRSKKIRRNKLESIPLITVVQVNHVHYNSYLPCKSSPCRKILNQEISLLVCKSPELRRRSPLDWSTIVRMWKPTAPTTSLWTSPIFISVPVRLLSRGPRLEDVQRVFFFLIVLALDYDWWTSNSYPNPFRFIVQCTVLADRSVHDIDFQLDLIDVNDNAPRFSQSIYHINLLESTPINTIISTAISAVDPDSGLFGTFSYYLQSNASSYAVSLLDEWWNSDFCLQSYFRLISTSNASLILTHALEYNSIQPDFNLTILAQVREWESSGEEFHDILLIRTMAIHRCPPKRSSPFIWSMSIISIRSLILPLPITWMSLSTRPWY